MLNEYLGTKTQDKRKVVYCSSCGHVFGPISGNYKLHALISEGPISRAGPQTDPLNKNKKYVFRQFCCPGCYRLLESEIVLRGSPVEWDIKLAG
ncbi:MAG: acetone carboxylase subunit gamma [Dehalococcoidia bacterium]|nr:acetone carboxylase subunit gamma [Dehalococcoidia bacterium]MDZ4247255.1 acetone carboxylase subunit gamma [Dehalococcoidia bacterium]